MRRFIFTLLVLLLAISFAFTTSKPSLDGRAVVAEEGVLPQGLFAKTVGYLPGDSVSVTNPATGITISVLILGSIDPSAGVAILLSPEAADKLFITPESNTQVKITKRSGMLDESVVGSGTVTGTNPSDTFIPNDIKEDLDAELEAVDKALGANTVEEVPEVIAEEPVETSLPPDENTADLALIPPTEEIIPEEDLSDEYTVTSMEEVPMNHVLADSEPVYIVESVDEEEMIPLPTLENEVEPEVVITEEIPEEESIVLVPVEPESSEVIETSIPEEDTVLASTEDKDLVDPFAPIILVPADEHPPQESASAILPETKIITPTPPETNIAKNIVPSTNNLGADKNNLIKTLSDLEKGKYYVQIATSSDQNHIDQLFQEYGLKYPMVMVPMKNGKAMQMMIGPLNVDEYGAVLAKFKKLGFKDSFLRKIR